MAALELKDITNLPSSLPISLIPQGQPRPSKNSIGYGLHRHFPQQRRVSALSGNDSGCDLMDDSLTDMQWLQKMDAGSDFPGLTHAQCRKKMCNKGSRPVGKDGCRKKLEYSSKKGTNKPPLSYASLIALAICSTPQRMMTLSSIYRWIEYTFPFYRTPEAKAWKNSIRHNLSIRKNMFMKVYQYPPRRGNGSYWTLLSEGEEELKKAVPLFATLQPPVIDSNCAYHREPSTHTVKSKGKFVPVLPRSDMSSNGLPYFSIGSSNFPAGFRTGNNPNFADDANEVVVGDMSGVDLCTSEQFSFCGKGHLGKRPRHLNDHSYAKSWHPEGVMGDNLETKVVELAAGISVETKAAEWDDSAGSDNSFTDPSTPKRKKSIGGSGKQKMYPVTGNAPRIVVKSEGAGTTVSRNSPSFTTPPKEQDNSLHLLDSSFLTPLKTNLGVPDVEIGAISFSPLYANLITPKQDSKKYSNQSTSDTSSHPFFPSPLTPLKNSLDSGVFSPLQSDCLGAIKFSTPTDVNSLSPLADLSAFSSLQPELYPFKVLDNSESGATPLRPGSLQALGLPGLTPPSRK